MSDRDNNNTISVSSKNVCVITGGGSGMGLATAHRMIKRGYYTILFL